MKSSFLKTALFAVVIGAAPVLGQEPGKFSLRSDLGVSIMYDFELGGQDITFDPGFRFDVAPAYRVNKQLILEFETGLIFNEFSRMATASLEGSHCQIPLLAQAIWQPPLRWRIKPFCEFGAGGAYDYSTIDHFNGAVLNYTEDGVYPAFQATFGIDWRMTTALHAGVVYKYLYVLTEEHFNVPNRPVVESNGTKTQSVSFRLEYLF